LIIMVSEMELIQNIKNIQMWAGLYNFL
jgi:hypothetical protein